MSKTPRTDEFCIKTKGMDYCDTVCGWLDFAEKLETELADKDRQLAESRAEIAALKRVNVALNEEIKIQRAYVTGRDNTIEHKDKLIEQMREALRLALAADICPAKNYWQTVETEHHRGECWHAKAKAALSAAERTEK